MVTCKVGVGGGIYVEGASVSTPANVEIRRYCCTGSIPIVSATQANLGTLATPTPTPSNILTDATAQLEAAWGFDFHWLIGLLIVAGVLFGIAKFAGTTPIAMGLAGLFGTGLAVALQFWPVWVLLLVALFIVAIFSKILFGGGELSQ